MQANGSVQEPHLWVRATASPQGPVPARGHGAQRGPAWPQLPPAPHPQSRPACSTPLEPNSPGCSHLPVQGNCTGGRCGSGDRANPAGTGRKVTRTKVPSSGLIPFAPGGRSSYSCPRSRVLFSTCAADVLSWARGSSPGPVTVWAGMGGDRVPPGKELRASPPTSKFN